MDASVVARLLEQTARAVYEARGPKAIHAGQWAVLRYLARAGRQARTVGGVATYLGVTHAPASRAVASLARKDLVTVKADAEDRRTLAALAPTRVVPAGAEALVRVQRWVEHGHRVQEGTEPHPACKPHATAYDARRWCSRTERFAA